MQLSAAALEARGWGWRHAGRRAFAVRDLDLCIRAGERVLLLGESGAGKSTVLAAAAGLLGRSDEGEQRGELLLDGRPAAHQRGRAGLVLQDPASQVLLARCGDDVAFGCENLGVPRDEIWRRVDEALSMVGLEVPHDRPTAALSGGQQQRLALAGVLAMRPGLLLLDEPTANLDPDGVAEVRDAVRAVLDATGATCLIVEHRVPVWTDVVDRVVVLAAGGGVLADGPVEDVLRSQGAALAASGIWVPGHPPARPVRRPGAATGETLLAGRALDVARPGAPVVAAAADVDVRAGICTAVVGPNGAGKSTLALTLAGLLAPVAGALDAAPRLARGMRGAPHRWPARGLLSRIGTVFQDPEHQFLRTTVADELRHGPALLGEPEAVVAARVDELLERLRLGRLAAANPFTLSGGEKRRLSVATALATRPDALVLDEPTFGQDSRTWAELAALVGDLLDVGRAVVTVTHDEAFVDALADDVLVLAARGAGVPP